MFGIAISAVFFGTGLLTAPDAGSAEAIDVRGRLVDEQGAAIADATILAVQKIWPNGRYQQRMLKTTTDKDGNFVFADFSQPGRQYGVLLTVVSDTWLLTSEYRLVRDGKQQDVITLTTEKSKPVTLQFRDAKGKPVSKMRALPTRRFLKDDAEYLTYSQQVRSAGVSVDDKGEVRFGSWKPGEKGMIAYIVDDQISTLDVVVPDDRIVSITVAASGKKPVPNSAIHVDGRVVDASGKPVSKVQVMAIQKTWPNNRYRQNALVTTTDEDGTFRFDKFAVGGSRYAYLLTVIADGYAMTSKYQVVANGSQQEPETLKLEKAEAVTFTFQDSEGNSVQNLEVCPSGRTVSSSTEFSNYSMHMKLSSKRTDKNGQVSFTAWKPGDAGAFHSRYQGKYGELMFQVGENRKVTIELP